MASRPLFTYVGGVNHDPFVHSLYIMTSSNLLEEKQQSSAVLDFRDVHVYSMPGHMI